MPCFDQLHFKWNDLWSSVYESYQGASMWGIITSILLINQFSMGFDHFDIATIDWV
jgi:hypothetical protein